MLSVRPVCIQPFPVPVTPKYIPYPSEVFESAKDADTIDGEVAGVFGLATVDGSFTWKIAFGVVVFIPTEVPLSVTKLAVSVPPVRNLTNRLFRPTIVTLGA
jgi:hypothetical protein